MISAAMRAIGMKPLILEKNMRGDVSMGYLLKAVGKVPIAA